MPKKLELNKADARRILHLINQQAVAIDKKDKITLKKLTNFCPKIPIWWSKTE